MQRRTSLQYTTKHTSSLVTAEAATGRDDRAMAVNADT
jgi:hypothetical protein